MFQMATPSLHPALCEFASDLTSNFSAADVNPAQAEDQLKGPTRRLLEAAGAIIGTPVIARTEALTGGGVRPDLGVSAKGLLAGHVELKAPGKGARPRSFTDPHDREQFRKLSNHPNLLYTDGNEWSLYRHGSLVGKVVRAPGDVRTDGAAAYDETTSGGLELLLRDFIGWNPLVPSSPKALAELLAPLARLLRDHVQVGVAEPESALQRLAGEWREYFFPDATDDQFADAYAQTVTYALLLARVEGEKDIHSHAVETLERRHGLLAQVLRWLSDPAARKEVAAPIDLLERAIGEVDHEEVAKRSRDRDLWLYFYEDFLAAYDPNMRRQSGVYFTPPAVVHAQTTIVEELLREQFGKALGFADDDVTVLDPAAGTGTYLISALGAGVDRTRAAYGDGAVAARVSVMANQFHGFETLIGPYAVSLLRFSERILADRGELPKDGVHVYLTDTIASPYEAPRGLAHAPLFHQKLADEDQRARRIKAEVPILVCIGNPPYFRQVVEPGDEGQERLGKWIRKGDEQGQGGILEDFLRDTPGVHAKNLYNLYVYFWRWALWKVFESEASRGPGIVSFISASSYLRGPGFAGMRRHMREVFDDLWIIDLGGELRGARKSENVFSIQTPVAIAVGVRYGMTRASEPARVRYLRIEGPRQAKYDQLFAIEGLENLSWRDCYDGWTQPLLPEGEGDYFSWPLLTDLFPWQHSGVQYKRTWPIGPDRLTLEARWNALVSSGQEQRRILFRETGDRTISGSYSGLEPRSAAQPRIADLEAADPHPPVIPYAYRTLDRQFALADARVCSRPRPPLWATLSARQLFMTSLLTKELGMGPSASITHLMPDLDHFSARGGKDVIPLWRNSGATEPNVLHGVLERLPSDATPEDLFAYAYAILAAPSYANRFADELEIPGPRLPLTRERSLFERSVDLGRTLIWLQTLGERFVPKGHRVGDIPPGDARCEHAVGETPADYPREHSYDEERQELRVGSGVFAPVSPAVRRYSVSGLDVIGSWLDYRMKEGAGRRSSPLDEIRPEVWPASFTEELLHLLWILEHTVKLQPELDNLLNEIVAGPLWLASELPEPTEAARAAPSGER